MPIWQNNSIRSSCGAYYLVNHQLGGFSLMFVYFWFERLLFSFVAKETYYQNELYILISIL